MQVIEEQRMAVSGIMSEREINHHKKKKYTFKNNYTLAIPLLFGQDNVNVNELFRSHLVH